MRESTAEVAEVGRGAMLISSIFIILEKERTYIVFSESSGNYIVHIKYSAMKENGFEGRQNWEKKTNQNLEVLRMTKYQLYLSYQTCIFKVFHGVIRK